MRAERAVMKYVARVQIDLVWSDSMYCKDACFFFVTIFYEKKRIRQHITYQSQSQSQFIMVTHDTQQHTCAFFGWRHRTHTHACRRGRSEMYPLHLSHPGLSFLRSSQEQWAAFMAPGDQVKWSCPSWSGTDRRVICSLACFFCRGSKWRKTLVNTGRTCKLHTERPGR